MNKYKNGKIYKLTSKYTDKIYIGSTIQLLKNRRRVHKSKKSNNTNSKLITQYTDFKIQLIENYPCENKRELRLREAYFIRLYFKLCVNTVIPFRTYKEYYQDNKEKIKKNSKNYRIINNSEVKEKKAKFREDNRERIRKEDRERYIKNKEVLKQKRLDNIDEVRRKAKERYRKNNPKPVLKCKVLMKKEKKEYDNLRRFWINSFGGRIDTKSYNNNLLHISIDLFH